MEERQLSTPQDIAEAGHEIYQNKYMAEYEDKHSGQFVAIDVRTGKAYVAPHPEEALGNAKTANPDGLFHLVKIGSPGAFRVSYTSNAVNSWLS